MDIFLLALANIVDPATLLFMVIGVGAGLMIFASANRKISMLHLEPSQGAARQKHLKHE